MGCPEVRVVSRDTKSYDNMLGSGYAQVAISTTVRVPRTQPYIIRSRAASCGEKTTSCIACFPPCATSRSLRMHCCASMRECYLADFHNAFPAKQYLQRRLQQHSVDIRMVTVDHIEWAILGVLQDVYKTAEAIRAAGGKITREPGPLPGLVGPLFSQICLLRGMQSSRLHGAWCGDAPKATLLSYHHHNKCHSCQFEPCLIMASQLPRMVQLEDLAALLPILSARMLGCCITVQCDSNLSFGCACRAQRFWRQPTPMAGRWCLWTMRTS